MRNEPTDHALDNKRATNVETYIQRLHAALKARQKLTNNAPLTVKIQPEHEIPLAQRILLR